MTQAQKVALVTGATRGIGLETAKQLATRGLRVLLTGRDADAVREASGRLRDAGLPVQGHRLDVTSRPSIEDAFGRISEEHGEIDVLINNAGVRIEEYGMSPSEQPLDRWRATFETNLFGVVSVTQVFLPLLRKSDAGRIVNVSSLLGSVGTHSDAESYVYNDKFKSLPAYSASKSALNSWTVHLAYELRQTRIKVNAAHPGYTVTDMNEGDGVLDVSAGAATSVGLALIGEDGPSGGYFHLGDRLQW